VLKYVNIATTNRGRTSPRLHPCGEIGSSALPVARHEFRVLITREYGHHATSHNFTLNSRHIWLQILKIDLGFLSIQNTLSMYQELFVNSERDNVDYLAVSLHKLKKVAGKLDS
jgi:hypothetical protein